MPRGSVNGKWGQLYFNFTPLVFTSPAPIHQSPIGTGCGNPRFISTSVVSLLLYQEVSIL
ncbi:MAG: hypothetical protein DDT23_00539 [candidate division WS2 bacterium]|nr:hypothetical protein [Candidatus Lithacetigena glycinireducens]